MNNIVVKLPTKTDALTFLTMLEKLGYAMYNPYRCTYDGTAVGWIDSSYPKYDGVHVRTDLKRMDGGVMIKISGPTHSWPEDAGALVGLLTGAEVKTISNVGDYSATVTKENVQIHNQQITHAKMREVLEAINTITQ